MACVIISGFFQGHVCGITHVVALPDTQHMPDGASCVTYGRMLLKFFPRLGFFWCK